jgi:hypothetical protein
MLQKGGDPILPVKGNIRPDYREIIWGVYPMAFALIPGLNLRA